MISFNHSEQLEVEGFTQYHTGGGCMALQKSLDDGSEILITEHETQYYCYSSVGIENGYTPAKIPLKEDKTVLIGLYDKNGNSQYYENVPIDSIPSVLNAIYEQDPDSAILAKHLYKS